MSNSSLVWKFALILVVGLIVAVRFLAVFEGIGAGSVEVFLSSISVPIAEAFGLGVMAAIVVALIKGMSAKEVVGGVVHGCKGVTIGALVLALAVTLGTVSGELGTAAYIVDATSAVSVIGADDPALDNVVTLEESLDYIPGVSTVSGKVNVRGSKTLGEKLDTYRDDALLARQLTGIACNAPIEDAETALQRSVTELGEINALFDEANIGTALRRQAERISDLSRY